MNDYRLILGDCLEVLPTLEAGSIDAVVTDPPYGQSNEKYDKGVDPAVWRACFRLAKADAALLSFAGSPTYHRIASGIEAGSWRVRQMWAWVYRDGFITSAYPREGFDRLAPAMDPICYATKGKVLLKVEREGDNAWNGAPRRKPVGPLTFSERAGGTPRQMAGVGHYPRTIVSDGSEPFTFFVLARGGGGHHPKARHPNEKPLPLMRWLLDKLPAGGVVLDPFMGSGSTGMACLQAGRRFIGIECNPHYFATAQRRLAEAHGPLFAGGRPA